jgi:hypothetical protein
LCVFDAKIDAAGENDTEKPGKWWKNGLIFDFFKKCNGNEKNYNENDENYYENG